VIGASVRASAADVPSMPERTTLAALDDHPHAEVFETRRPRTVRLELDAGEDIPRHTHAGTNVVFHLLTGRLNLTLDDETYALNAGEVIRFDGSREVSPAAVKDSTALIVFAPAPEADSDT
jgi:quercetin dioxygenase-like cupin family protein